MPEVVGDLPSGQASIVEHPGDVVPEVVRVQAFREELSTLREAAQTLERHISRLRQSLEPRR